MISDDHSFSDSFETAKALAAAIREQEEVDLVLCGTGSSDLYNQVTGIQLGTLLDWPTLNNVTSIQPNGDTVLVERTLENSTEVFEVALPAVLSVSSLESTFRLFQLCVISCRQVKNRLQFLLQILQI